MNKGLNPVQNSDSAEHHKRLKRLIFRSGHRGCKETDLVLGRFAAEELPNLSASELDIYEQLLDEDDMNIWDWLVGRCAPENPAYQPFITRMQNTAPKP